MRLVCQLSLRRRWEGLSMCFSLQWGTMWAGADGGDWSEQHLFMTNPEECCVVCVCVHHWWRCRDLLGSDVPHRGCEQLPGAFRKVLWLSFVMFLESVCSGFGCTCGREGRTDRGNQTVTVFLGTNTVWPRFDSRVLFICVYLLFKDYLQILMLLSTASCLFRGGILISIFWDSD